MLYWASQHSICCFLDNNNYSFSPHTHECIVAVGSIQTFCPQSPVDYFTELDRFVEHQNDWIFGHFNYDLKNEIESIKSSHTDHIDFPVSFLFVPQVILQLGEAAISIGIISGNADDIFKQITQQIQGKGLNHAATFTPRISKADYLSTIENLRGHIKQGDCYEINFCQEFFAENLSIDPLTIYQKLVEVSPNPFACFYKLDDKFLCCASPERFLKREGNHIISQPIKGTSLRNADTQLDAYQKHLLLQSEKDKSENIMVVDLVRNDLSRVCNEGSVVVDEMCEVYSFPGVHQMISTVSGVLKTGIHFADILKATFPMGSMTGAPKKRVMELIETYEETRRGIYSGTVGYITPTGDFDFNVVIRSLMYNSANKYLSYQVGGGITYNSIAHHEYEECLAKVSGISKVFST